jgi:hypothetical protein
MKIVNTFLDEGVRNKFRMMNDTKKLLTFVNPENLPEDYGGSATKIAEYEE